MVVRSVFGETRGSLKDHPYDRSLLREMQAEQGGKPAGCSREMGYQPAKYIFYAGRCSCYPVDQNITEQSGRLYSLVSRKTWTILSKECILSSDARSHPES